MYSALSRRKPIKYLLFKFGQSNEKGISNNVAPLGSYIRPNENALIMGAVYAGGTGVLESEITEFQVLDYSQGTNLGTLHGSENGLCLEYKKPIGILKVAQGDTSIKANWYHNSKLRNKMIEYRNKAEAAYKGYDIRWIITYNIWETVCTLPADAATLETDSNNLINTVFSGRNIVAMVVVKPNPNSNLYINNPSTAATVVTQLTNFVSARPYARFVEVPDLALHDGIHYTSLALHELGRRQALAIKEVLQ